MVNNISSASLFQKGDLNFELAAARISRPANIFLLILMVQHLFFISTCFQFHKVSVWLGNSMFRWYRTVRNFDVSEFLSKTIYTKRLEHRVKR